MEWDRLYQINDVVTVHSAAGHTDFLMGCEAQAAIKLEDLLIALFDANFDLLSAQLCSGVGEGLNQRRANAASSKWFCHHQTADFRPFVPTDELCVGHSVSTGFSHQMDSLPPVHKVKRTFYVVDNKLGRLFGKAVTLQVLGIGRGNRANAQVCRRSFSFFQIPLLLSNKTRISRFSEDRVLVGKASLTCFALIRILRF